MLAEQKEPGWRMERLFRLTPPAEDELISDGSDGRYSSYVALDLARVHARQ